MVKARRSAIAVLAMLGVWMAAAPRAGANPAVTEYQLKAVFLLNFARFRSDGEGAEVRNRGARNARSMDGGCATRRRESGGDRVSAEGGLPPELRALPI